KSRAAGGASDDNSGLEFTAGARRFFNDPLLAEPLRKCLTHEARNDVRRETSSIRDDDTHRPRRIGLRPSDARHSRQRSSAGGQTQKSTAGKVHFDPSLRALFLITPSAGGRNLSHT